MNAFTRLKLCSVLFTVFWIAGMVWWSEAFAPANIIILSICGALGRLFLVPRDALAIPAHGHAAARRADAVG